MDNPWSIIPHQTVPSGIIRPQPTLDLRRSAKMARMNQPIASLRSHIPLKLLTSVSMWWSIWFVLWSRNQGTSTTARHERSWHGTSSSHAPRRPNLMKEHMKNMWEPSLRWGCDYDTSFQFHNNWFPDGSQCCCPAIGFPKKSCMQSSQIPPHHMLQNRWAICQSWISMQLGVRSHTPQVCGKV